MAGMNVPAVLQQLDGLFRRGEYDRVEPFMLEAVAAAEAARDKGAVLALLNELMGFYRSLSRGADSLRVARRALGLVEELGLQGSVHHATTLLNVATAYRADGQIDTAIAQFTEAGRLLDALPAPDPRLRATLHNNLSLAWQEAGAHDKALAELEQALPLVRTRADGEVDVAVTLTNMALSRLRLGQLTEARDELFEAIALFERQAQLSGHYSAALAGLAEVAYREGRLEDAVACYERALADIEARHGRNMHYVITLESLALACETLDPQRAGDLAGQARAIRATLV
ncbi:tetratricopeptide repeat protein [Uliginosibacterium sp. H1]|uniref:tetratricopeptide repeat protein n=1 Tax=Uliginosibacterium sp. H1 TaxID=3114757 RepID=UPI002E195DBD|nr:tetratricopeptide repeat protein [Uliginosibacterium sp. H1]